MFGEEDVTHGPPSPAVPRPAGDGRGRSRVGMSLRARVLAAMALVAVVLLGAGMVVVRTTSTHLMDQVDAQLARASGPRGPLPPGPATDGTGGGGAFVGPSGASADTTFNTLYLGVVDGDAVVSRVLPTGSGSTPPVPDVTAAQAVRSAPTDEPLAVEAVGGGPRFPVIAHFGDRTGS